ncbi:MAG TPA: antibiotic biosynthesis monooxygenase [Chitinophagales bacterium]|jgi:quinol monooxygenase YgiN|nr:antibiotic biosynthesis monooxygenase [Chitinophagales bacterium]MBP6154057.1 antibiotic biosynthesis monooxygenase [Chitinophagales bacterium]HQV78541.1 antibiotic biosynthesis monooxygenase [Chitinophagales bacterium]HQW78773.1 antibiotic biosynthesis monooxygenase [Chitinophagales bacterium]HRB18583.1 antibiotic biosynthesis monooxygenase [Chitinophagales bacterium]
MIVRIVKLTMREEEVDTFKNYFNTVCETIRSQPGCHLLQAWQDIHHPNIFFTYSLWDSEQDLDTYRNSDFFAIFWKTVKAWFGAKAEVWSFDKIVDLP